MVGINKTPKQLSWHQALNDDIGAETSLNIMQHEPEPGKPTRYKIIVEAMEEVIPDLVNAIDERHQGLSNDQRETIHKAVDEAERGLIKFKDLMDVITEQLRLFWSENFVKQCRDKLSKKYQLIDNGNSDYSSQIRVDSLKNIAGGTNAAARIVAELSSKIPDICKRLKIEVSSTKFLILLKNSYKILGGLARRLHLYLNTAALNNLNYFFTQRRALDIKGNNLIPREKGYLSFPGYKNLNHQVQSDIKSSKQQHDMEEINSWKQVGCPAFFASEMVEGPFGKKIRGRNLITILIDQFHAICKNFIPEEKLQAILSLNFN